MNVYYVCKRGCLSRLTEGEMYYLIEYEDNPYIRRQKKIDTLIYSSKQLHLLNKMKFSKWKWLLWVCFFLSFSFCYIFCRFNFIFYLLTFHEGIYNLDLYIPYLRFFIRWKLTHKLFSGIQLQTFQALNGDHLRWRNHVF